MTAAKDYYATLGVLPSAEDIVIRAAYRALAQRYHPDKWAGEKDEAERRMKEINEAYAVLSDAKRRAEYDAARKAEGASEEFSADEEDVRDAFTQAEKDVDADWEVALEYFPDLEEIHARLRETSVSLAFSFMATLLETKQFNNRIQLAQTMEDQFLRTYFGSNEKIISFARLLIALKEKGAARELNRAVAVLGSDVDASKIVSRISEKHQIKKNERQSSSAIYLAKIIVGGAGPTTAEAQRLIETIGGNVQYVYREDPRGLSSLDRIKVHVNSQEYQFGNSEELAKWTRGIAVKIVRGTF